MTSSAASVEEYLSALPDDRRRAIESVREVILKNLSGGFEEVMQYGGIGYVVPHSLYPAGYHCDPRQPLPFANLVAQKNHLSLHLMAVYGDGELREQFERAWAAAGKKLDMGKACIRFKKAEDLALDVIGETVARVPASEYVARYEAARRRSSKK